MPVVAQTERWFPARDSTSVVGRFIDVECDDPVASKKANKPVKMYRAVLQAKIAGSTDVSAQVVKDFNKEDFCERFPGAWEHYEKLKATVDNGPDPDMLGIKGTPVDEGNMFNNERIAWFKAQGIYTLEQVRDLSDTTIENMGRSGGIGAKGWRKKAREYLASKAANGGR